MKGGCHHCDLANALVAAATVLVETGGDLSLREAALKVGVTANAAYRHFGDKSDHLTAVAAGGYDDLAALMDTVTVEAGAATRLRAIATAYVDLSLARPEMFRLKFGAHGLCRISTARLNASRTPPGMALVGVLDNFVAEGLTSPGQPSGRASAGLGADPRLCGAGSGWPADRGRPGRARQGAGGGGDLCPGGTVRSGAGLTARGDLARVRRQIATKSGLAAARSPAHDCTTAMVDSLARPPQIHGAQGEGPDVADDRDRDLPAREEPE